MAQLIHGTTINGHIAIHAGNMSDHSIATTSYVTTQISNLINGAPGALDTLNELAAALGNDASFSSTLTNSLAAKLALSGGTMTGNINWAQTDRGITWGMNTDGAYIKFFNTGDGDADSRLEYSTSDNGDEYHRWMISGTEKMTLKGDGLRVANTIYASGGNSGNWNTAYGWGNHAGLYSAAGHSHTFASLTSKPTTISGYGITDAITTGNIGSQSVSYASSAGNADTLDSYHADYLGNRVLTKRGFTVNGDRNTYYPVLIDGSGAFAFNRYSIYRGYSWTAPDTWNTSTHKGGLTFDFEWSGDTAWGGNDHTLRVIQFSETYSNMVAGFALPVTGGACVWLRGGGAYYEIQTDGNPVTPTVYLGDFTAGNGAVFSPRTDLSNVTSEIYNRMVIRGNATLYDNGNRVATSRGEGTNYIDYSRYVYNNGAYSGTGWGEPSDLGVRYAASAGSVAWTNVSSRPTALSQFTNDLGNYGGFLTSLPAHNHDGVYVRAYTTTNDNIDSDWGQSFKTFDPVPSGTPPISSPNLRTINIGENFSRRTQLAFNYATDQAWFRRNQDGTWYSWREFFHTGNFTDNSSNWNTAYNKRPTAISFSGTSTKTLTLTQGDGSTLTASFSDIDTDTNTDAQTLSLSGNTLSISGGNSVTLSSSGLSQATADGLYVAKAGGSTVAGITYFSNGESINLYGIRGRYSGDGMHLYGKVDIGNPNGWGAGIGNTPSFGLSTYGGAYFAYNQGTVSVGALGTAKLHVIGNTSGQELFAVDGVNGRLFSVVDDLSDSLYSVNTIAGLPVLEVFANNIVTIGKFGTNAIYVGQDGRVGFGTTDFSYTAADQTSPTNNRLFVNGSIQLLGNNDAIVFGRGTATVLRDEKLAFGWGSGWYMEDADYLRVVGNKTVYSGGSARFDSYIYIGGASYYLYQANSGIWTNGNLGASGDLYLGTRGTWLSSWLNQNLTTGASPTFNDIYADNWFRNNGSNEGLYNQSTTQHWSSNTNGYWDASSTTSVSAIRFYTGGHVTSLRGYVYANSSNEIGFLNSAGNWGLRMDNSYNVQIYGTLSATNFSGSHSGTSSGTNTGDQTNISGNSGTTSQRSFDYLYASSYLESGGAVYGTIFYDNNERDYYADFNTTSNSAIRVRGGMLMGPNPTWGAYLQVGGNGNESAYASVVTTNGNLHLDAADGRGTYINHYSGGTIYFGTAGTWTITGDGSYYNGTAAAANSVAWTNVSSRPTALSQFSNDLGNYGGWITSSGSISGTAARATRANGNFYIDDNYGNTVVGVYASTRLQGVFAMGDSYKLPADGSSSGSLYGMAWSHPNAGGVAGNLNTHGLLVMENGTFLAAISGSIRARDDMRAPALYDSGSRVAISRGEGRNYVDYSRYVYNNGAYSGSGWIEPSDLGVRYANSAGSLSNMNISQFSNNSGYITASANVASSDRLYPFGAAIDSTHPGYGLRAWYDWAYSGTYRNGISLGSNPGDQAYGWQLWQNMWDDRTYTRRYNSGWQTTRTLMTTQDDPYAANMNQYVRTSDSVSFSSISSGAIYSNNWFRAYGDTGLYLQDYGGHFRRNTNSSHGTFEIFGYAKGGYNGLLIKDDAGYFNNYMHEGGNGGLYCENQGGRWPWYWHRGNTCLGLGNSTTSSSYRVYVNGSLYAEGDIVAYSDARKKTDIITIDNALDKVLQLRGVYYTRIDETEKGRQTGVIAQEINEVLPEVVTYAPDVDEYGVKYGNIAGILIEAVKEQQKQIAELKEEIKKLRGE